MYFLFTYTHTHTHKKATYQSFCIEGKTGESLTVLQTNELNAKGILSLKATTAHKLRKILI